jgi:hypothetical protein
MRCYSEGQERAVRLHDLLREWTRQRLLDPVQARSLGSGVHVDVVRTNAFLRLGLIVFTAFVVATSVIYVVSFWNIVDSFSIGVVTAVAALVCVCIAEGLIGFFHFYRYGVEEMLVVSSIVLFGMSVGSFWASGHPPGGLGSHAMAVGLAAAACAGVLAYFRFGFVVASIGSVVCASLIPFQFQLGDAGRRMSAAAIFAVVFLIARTGRRRYDEEWPGDEYGAVQAVALAGLYFVLNVKIAFDSITAGAFYWFTYAMMFVVPAAGLVLSIRDKDRPLLTVSIVMAIGTLVSNKPYLGWTRHEWDPIILGLVLMAVALGLRRWISSGVNGQRRGFTVTPVASDQKTLFAVLSAVPFGMHTHAPASPPASPSTFDGGRSGGAGGGAGF